MNCGNCHKCLSESATRAGRQLNNKAYLEWTELGSRMLLCPECGNKRCPKASDHELACTGSNEQGQIGSVYSEYNFRTAE